jgi:hypothetical protein
MLSFRENPSWKNKKVMPFAIPYNNEGMEELLYNILSGENNNN